VKEKSMNHQHSGRKKRVLVDVDVL